jgi:hypothetical protein
VQRNLSIGRRSIQAPAASAFPITFLYGLISRRHPPAADRGTKQWFKFTTSQIEPFEGGPACEGLQHHRRNHRPFFIDRVSRGAPDFSFPRDRHPGYQCKVCITHNRARQAQPR